MNSKTLILLIDFDNYFNNDIYNRPVEEFEFEIKRIIESILYRNLNIENISIRLYAGWYSETELTKNASNIISKISLINLFPIIKGNVKIHGNIELATSLYYAADLMFYNTYQEKQGIPRLRINREMINEHCESNKSKCPIFIMHNFTKNKKKICNVQGCALRHNNVFYSKYQKMVDTMIACDLIEFSENENILFLISDDTDHIPALIQSSKKNTNIFVGIRNNYKIEYYNAILNNYNIETITLS